MIERKFDIPFIANLALREKQIQQNYRPIIAVHKWFARRPGTLFRGLLLSEFSDKPLQDAFYQSNNFKNKRIADPFIGGGTPLLEANRTGCDVIGCDINPMAYWIVRQELEHLDLDAYAAAAALRRTLESDIGGLYRTRCAHCGAVDAPVKYFLWVKTLACAGCGRRIDLFPGYLVARNRRHPKNVFVCGTCGGLSETADRKNPGDCASCGERILTSGPARRSSCACRHCGAVNRYPRADEGPPQHRMFAMEYHCFTCKPDHNGRFFKAPDARDHENVIAAEGRWNSLTPSFIPDDAILPGDESSRLLRWGYRFYHEMFNTRQKLALESSCRLIDREANPRIRNALATNLSDLLRYQNMLCRYDAMALKSLDIFSVHGFPVGLIQCESNFLGIPQPGRYANVGSGGWSNIIDKYTKAKKYCDFPFEIRHRNGKKIQTPIPGEWIGDTGNGRRRAPRSVDISCDDASQKTIAEKSLDAVLTDPPYFGNVQYAELMDFCYVWLRKLLNKKVPAFYPKSTRNPRELTGNENMGRNLIHFTEGLSAVLSRMARALKTGAPLVFTYHHNKLSAYYPVAAAILDAGLTCSASFPCPAEMGASIHISNTRSAIIDTVFVSRSTGKMRRKWLADSPRQLAGVVGEDYRLLKQGGMNPTRGDLRCVISGHLIRLAVWRLRTEWQKDIDTEKRLQKVEEWINHFGDVDAVGKCLDDDLKDVPRKQPMLRELELKYGEDDDEIPFECQHRDACITPLWSLK